MFTRYLVEGLRDGSADLDGDGDITLDELYGYVYDRVVEEMPQQRPKKQDNVEGRIIIARNINWSLPAYLRNALSSPIATDRLGALDGLAHLYRIGNDIVRGCVRDEIQHLADDDSKLVSAAATARLRSILPQPGEQMPKESRLEAKKIPEPWAAEGTIPPAQQTGSSVSGPTSVPPSNRDFSTTAPPRQPTGESRSAPSSIASGPEPSEKPLRPSPVPSWQAGSFYILEKDAPTAAGPPAPAGPERQGVIMLTTLVTVIMILLTGIGTVLIVNRSGGEPVGAPVGAREPAQAAAPSEGVTSIEDIFGPACDQVLPTEGEGSAQGMVDDPVGTAASNNPLLTTLTQTVMAAELVDTLNDPTAQYTVFAPTNSAFVELEASQPGITEALLVDPYGDLSTILTYHVIPQRYDAQSLFYAGSVASVQGGMVEITGTPDAPLVDGNMVLCGNIPTANATVFVIDSVLMPPAA